MNKKGKEPTWPQPTRLKPNAGPTQLPVTDSLRRLQPQDDKQLGGALGSAWSPAISPTPRMKAAALRGL
jgi:hypothetical protein